MAFLKKIFNTTSGNKHLKTIRLNTGNLKDFPQFEKLFNLGKIKPDSSGRLRYLHGAPVGDMLLKGVDSNNNPIYLESTEEWLDPDNEHAKYFIWQ